MNNQIDCIKDKIQEAQVVLVGLGLGFEDEFVIEDAKVYQPLETMGIKNKSELAEHLQNLAAAEWIHTILLNYYKKNHTTTAYKNLYELVKDKNYFVLSMCTSELIYQSGLEKDRIVMPCGNEGLFQCSQSCNHVVHDNTEYVNDFVKNLSEIMDKIKEGTIIDEFLPQCSNCKQRLTFNIRANVETYVEEGYLPQWQSYMNWLARTLNKNFVLLEFDVNFTLPSLIRWPFEKNAFLNNKATLVRVNKQFPQLTEEIKGKGISVEMTGSEFLELVNK